MTHLKEEDLVLHYYKEQDAPANAEAHLKECTECADKFAALAHVMASVETAPVPERSAQYGTEVWQRIQGQVIAREPKRSFSWSALFGGRSLAMAGAMVVLLVAAFYAGRFTGTEGHPPEPSSGNATPVPPERVRQKIMFVAVGEHLERSRMVLVELVNSPGQGMVDLSTTQAWAEDLVESNRLYRRTATSAGETGVASVLDELERVLLEVAHTPHELSQSELDLLRKRIESRGILFKMRVIETQMQKRQQEPAPADGASRTKS